MTVLIGSILLYISSAIFTGTEPIIETEIDARLNYYLRVTAGSMLLPAMLMVVGSILFKRNIKCGKAFLIAGAVLISIFPLLAIWQTYKVFGLSPILIVLIIGWLMITAIFALFFSKLNRF